VFVCIAKRRSGADEVFDPRQRSDPRSACTAPAPSPIAVGTRRFAIGGTSSPRATCTKSPNPPPWRDEAPRLGGRSVAVTNCGRRPAPAA
jgi:hypothetical protein